MRLAFGTFVLPRFRFTDLQKLHICRVSLILQSWLYVNSCTWAHDVHYVPKCMSCHKVIVVINGRAHCFHDNIYYAHLASVRFEHSVCCGSLMTTYDHTHKHKHTHTHTHTTHTHTHIYIYIYVGR